MRWIRSGRWSLASRLMTIALVPAALMLVIVNLAMYVMAQREVASEIAERGRLLAAALAEGSQYAVVSGNLGAVEQTIRGVTAADASVASIHVLDAARTVLLHVGSDLAATSAQLFEAPIAATDLDVGLFDTTGAPHVSGAEPSRDASVPLPPLGFIKVTMTPEPLLRAKRERLVLGNAIVAAAALLSAGVGLLLARRLRRPLDDVMRALRQIRQGRYDVALDPVADGELGELQAAIVEMAKGLSVSRQELEGLVATRTHALQAAVDRAQAADAEKRRLIARGNALVEEERRRISLEIHDDLNSALVSVSLQAAALAQAAKGEGLSDLCHAAERIAALVDALYLRARDIVKALRPEVIDALGLRGAIEELVRHVNEIQGGCRFVFEADAGLPRVSEEVAIAAYRVVQEVLTNVIKHAQATHCCVSLAVGQEDRDIEIEIRDDGIGFDANQTLSDGIGIVGMRERMTAIGGELTIQSEPKQGTSILIRLPADD